jgi:hypothetical protein
VRTLTLGLWDLAGWIRDDAYAAAPVLVSVQPERLDHWIDRAEQFVDMVTEMFPQAFTVWRSLHYCVVCPDWEKLMIGRLGLVVPQRSA